MDPDETARNEPSHMDIHRLLSHLNSHHDLVNYGLNLVGLWTQGPRVAI